MIGNVAGVNYAKNWIYADPNHGVKKENHLPVTLYEYAYDVPTDELILKLQDVDAKLKEFCKTTGRKMKSKIVFTTVGHDMDSYLITVQYLEEESDAAWEERMIRLEIHAKEYAARLEKQEEAMRVKAIEQEKKLYKELHKKYGKK